MSEGIAKEVIRAQKAGEEAKITMSAAAFGRWMTLMGFKNASQAANALGVSRNTISAYRSKGADERVRLACRSLARAAGKIKTIDVYEYEDA